MEFSLSWLKQFLETNLSAEELAKRMFELGMEVEGLTNEGDAFNRVVVGKIITRTQHPDADKLGVCMVEVGEAEPRQIVCGAPNARDGLTVAVALDGAVLPGDFVIKPTKMRGMKSDGMICSVRELGMGDEHQGIWEMDTNASAGTPLATAMGMDDVVFDVSITPNRGDVLSVYGIARDLAAAGAGTLKTVEKVQLGAPVANRITIVREDDNCPFFTGQLIEGVKNTASPAWLVRFLEQAGLRPINCIADLTNYLMLSYGQPMHAYDADKIKGNIRIAPAKGGETLEGLDGNTHTLAQGDVAIWDDSGVIGLAGIVGGEATAVDENTTNVYLEVAQFDKAAIAFTGQRLQCNTDARFRFERGIDPSMTATANTLATRKIVELCGGEATGLDFNGVETPAQRVIRFAPSKVRTFGGLDIPADEVKTALEAFGFVVTVTGEDAFDVAVPHHFTIMDTPEDLVEEVLRLKTLDAVPIVLPQVPVHRIVGADKGRKADRVARRTFAALGYLECINYSFINNTKAEMFAEGANLLVLDNPLDEEEMSTMRPSLIPSLLDAAAKNVARSEADIRLAEVGKVYTEDKETLKAAAILMGKGARSWKTGAAAGYDVYDVKADLEGMLSSLGLPADKLQVYTTNLPTTLHPGRSGSFALGKNVFGTFGEVHPRIMKAFGLKGSAVVLELDLDKVDAMNIKQGNFFTSTYQPVSRDFAFLVDENVAAGDVVNTLKGADKDLVRNVTLFDVYQGDGVAEGKKSIALSMTLQAADRTLSEDDINGVVQKVEKAVVKRFSAEIR